MVIAEDVLEKICQQYRPALMRYALYSTGNMEDAEEVVSFAFVQLWLHMDMANNYVENWLYRVVKNRIVDLHRKKNRQRSCVEVPLEDYQGSIEMGCDDRLDAASLLEGVLSLTGEDTKRMMLLHYGHGYTYKELAEVYPLRIAGIKMRVLRERDRLRAVHNQLVIGA